MSQSETIGGTVYSWPEEGFYHPSGEIKQTWHEESFQNQGGLSKSIETQKLQACMEVSKPAQSLHPFESVTISLHFPKSSSGRIQSVTGSIL